MTKDSKSFRNDVSKGSKNDNWLSKAYTHDDSRSYIDHLWREQLFK